MLFEVILYFTIFLLSILLLLFLNFKWKYQYWKNYGIPYLEPAFPFGNVWESMTGKLHFGYIMQIKYEQMKHCGDFCGLFFFGQPVLCALSPEMAKNILVKDFEHFMDRGLYFHEKVDPLSANLFFLEGQKWKTLRGKLTPTFTSGKLKTMFNTILDVGDELIVYLRNQTKVDSEMDIRDILIRFVIDIIGSCAFGLEINCLKNPDVEFYEKGRRTMNFPLHKSLKLFLSTMFRDAARKLNVRFNDKDIEEFYFKVVKDVINHRITNNVTRNDFMQLLVGMYENENSENSLSIGEITAQAFVFFFAGFETSSTTLTYALHLLSCHPEVQEKCRSEINVVLQEHNNNFTYESIMQMEYIDQVINETLRMYPPVASIHRIVSKEYQVPGTDVILPKGLPVVIPNYAIQNDPKIFPEPSKFNPERFSKENSSDRHPFAYLPFGEGPRICIGKRFGQLQTRLTLALLLKHFRFEPCSKTDIPIKVHPVNLIFAPLGEVWLKVTPV